jgi:hypothetical protein
MKELDSPEALAAVLRTEAASSLVAIDGHDGSGKSFLSSQLATILSWPVVHLDDFVEREQGGFVEHVRYDDLAPKLSPRPLIVEGVLVLDVLHRLSIEAGYLVHVKRVSEDGLWYDEDVCEPQNLSRSSSLVSLSKRTSSREGDVPLSVELQGADGGSKAASYATFA